MFASSREGGKKGRKNRKKGERVREREKGLEGKIYASLGVIFSR